MGSRALADDQITLPVAGLGTLVGGCRALVDRHLVLDPISAHAASKWPPSGPAPDQKLPEFVGFLCRSIDECVDRFVADPAKTCLRHLFETAGDLLRRPALAQAVNHE